MGRKRLSEEEIVARFRKRHGEIAANMIDQYGQNAEITCAKIARKSGTSRQNVHQLLARLGKHRLPKRPWGSRKRFIPEIETLLQYLYNRFGEVQHLEFRTFRVNGHVIRIGRRNSFTYKSLPLHFLNCDSRNTDFKIILHAGDVFVIPAYPNYLPISEFEGYRGRFDFLEKPKAI